MAKTFKALLQQELVEKYNQYHDKLGRFAHSPGGSQTAVVDGKKFKELIPENSYMKSADYKISQQLANEYHSASLDAFEEYKKAKTEYDALPSKPKNEWNEEDQYQALIGNRPKMGDKALQLKEKQSEAIQRMSEAEKNRDWHEEHLSELKSEARSQQMENYEYTKPKPATRNNYDGFRTDTTGTSYSDEFLNGHQKDKGYVAEMSPKEYIERCAYDIFNGATIESTIAGATEASIGKYTEMMAEGTKFDMPYLDYAKGGQEGRHRALAAYNLGIEKIPVLIIG